MTFGILLPNGCRYDDLVEMITIKMKVDNWTSCLKIDYDVGDNMALVKITNDNSLMFYMGVKKNPWITAYALRIEVVNVSNQYADEVEQEIQSSKSPFYLELEPHIFLYISYSNSNSVELCIKQ